MNYRFVGPIRANGWTAIHYAETHGGSVRHCLTGKTYLPGEIYKSLEAIAKHPTAKFNAEPYEYVAPQHS